MDPLGGAGGAHSDFSPTCKTRMIHVINAGSDFFLFFSERVNCGECTEPAMERERGVFLVFALKIGGVYDLELDGFYVW